MNTDNEKLNKRASRVLVKWGLENEMNQVQLKLAVESYARIQVKNRAMKWIALGGLFFVATFIGLMLGSVVIGLNISKDFKIRDGSLVQKGRNGEIIQTSQKYYSVNLKLSTPLDVIRGIKTVKIDLKDGKGSLSFSVVSFYYIKGKRLELYGVSHMAKVMGNGTIEIYPITHLNGEKRIDETNRVESDVGSATTTTKTSQVTNTEYIYDCQGLENMKTNGKYSLQNDIECKLERPLFFSEGESFEGTLEGNGNTITIKMKTNGVAGLFGVLNGATISNVLFRGDVSGVGYCAAVSVQTLPGTSFLSIGVYTNISCANNGNDSVTASSFSAVLLNPNNDNRTVVWKYSVSQATFNLILSREVQSFQAGFYGRVLPGQQVNTNFTFSYSASLFDVRQIDNGRISFYGFKNHQEKKYVYVPEDCYNYDKTNINFVNMCVNWFKEYRFENQECCSYFDSCPYLYCSFTSRVCMMCRNRYKSNLKQEYFEIVPVVNEN